MTTTDDAPEARLDYWGGILPEHIDAADAHNLVDAIHEQLRDSPSIQDALYACNLDPTGRVAWLAAASAVHVLLANEIGQEVGHEVPDEPETKEAAIKP
jgi:hypothetical protein